MAKYGPRWSPADYTPFYLIQEPTHTMKEVSAEYSRMRTLLIHRVERLEAAGIGEAQAAYVKQSLPTLKEIEKIHEKNVEEYNRIKQELEVMKRTKATRSQYKKLQRKLKRIPKTLREEVAERLSQARSIELERGYSLKGIKEIQQTINKETGELVPLGEVLSFREYMKSWRTSAFYKTIVGSGEAAGYHSDEYQDIGGSFTDFYTLYKSERYGA